MENKKTGIIFFSIVVFITLIYYIFFSNRISELDGDYQFYSKKYNQENYQLFFPLTFHIKNGKIRYGEGNEMYQNITFTKIKDYIELSNTFHDDGREENDKIRTYKIIKKTNGDIDYLYDNQEVVEFIYKKIDPTINSSITNKDNISQQQNKKSINCNQDSVLSVFKQHMDFNYPDWKIIGTPVVKESSDCTYQIRFSSYNPHLKEVGVSEKVLFIIQMNFTNDDKYNFSVIRGTLY